jgi:hypothetical protein
MSVCSCIVSTENVSYLFVRVKTDLIAAYRLNEWFLLSHFSHNFQFFNLGCLHPVACVRSGDMGFIRIRKVTIFYMKMVVRQKYVAVL